MLVWFRIMAIFCLTFAHNDGGMGAFGYLLVAEDHLAQTRQKCVSFGKWVRILLNRRDSSWRKYRGFLSCAAAISYRHEAISNVQFKETTLENDR